MKKIVYYLLAFTLFVTACMICVSAQDIDVYIDGAKVEFNASSGKPFIENGRTLVPLRVTMESFGAEVDWDASLQTAFVRKDTTTVRCIIGENCIYRNNVKIENDAAAVIKDGRTYLPIRVVLEAFGANVGWDGSVLVDSMSDDSYIKTVETSPSYTTNYWNTWNNALAMKQSGDYRGAINAILSISKVFISDNTSASRAMLFKHLGECHSNLGEYGKASACFKREAYYWSLTEGQNETRIDAERRSRLIKPYTQMYALSHDGEDFGAGTNFGVLHEPVRGAYIGAVYETFNRPVAGILEYLRYGSPNTYGVKDDQILQLSLQPLGGMSAVNNYDGYLIDLAKSLESSGCKVILRFAGEMNDSSTLWPSTPEVYIEKFRLVADVFHEYAPSVPIVWAPNFYPTDNIEAYYPGDEYVDYVGVSLYQEYQPETDPLNAGVDRNRWASLLDFIYSRYSHKKPIIVVEGGVAYANNRTSKDLTSYAVSQIKEFFAYLPVKYPNVKMFFIFNQEDTNGSRQFLLENNQACLDAYNNALNNKYFYSSTNYTPNENGYYELGNNVKVKAALTEICSYTYTPGDPVAYVIYYINGEKAGVSYGAPFGAKLDFSAYAGKTVELRASVFDSQHKQINSYSVNVSVVE